MATFVLTPGAWLGGWVWEPVTRRLRQAGHGVFPLTLSGMGEGALPGDATVDLETHIADVIDLVVVEELRDVTLVGHSYAGAVTAGVADRIGDRLAQAVYLDTAPPEDGESVLHFAGPDAAAAMRHQVEATGDGWRLDAPRFAEMPSQRIDGLSRADLALLQSRAMDQPWGTYRQPLRLRGGGEGVPRAVIACNDFRSLEASGVPRFGQYHPPAWQRRDLATGHWPMLSAPDELAAILVELATAVLPRRSVAAHAAIVQPA